MIYYRAMEKKGIINRERELPHTAEIMGVVDGAAACAVGIEG